MKIKIMHVYTRIKKNPEQNKKQKKHKLEEKSFERK